MKIAVIGAKGNLGSRVTKQALDRGHEVKAIIYMGENRDERSTVLEKSLFDLTKEDIAEADVIISAYGSGFQADPSINRGAFLHYIKLIDKTDKRLISIGGAGSLYSDDEHKIFEYEQPSHPDFLREISKNIKLGIDELFNSEVNNWTVVCPSRQFDPEGPLTGKYIVGTDNQIIYNEEGKSYVTYEDLAMAMIDIAESGNYNKQKITIATR